MNTYLKGKQLITNLTIVDHCLEYENKLCI